MAVTYYLSSTNSNLGGGYNYSKVFITTPSAQSDLTISIAVGATEDDFGFSPASDPGASGGTGTFTIKVNVITGNTSVMMSVTVARVDAFGVEKATGSFTAEQTASAGIKTFTVSSPALGTWDPGDRLRVTYRWRSTATMGNAHTIVIRLNTVDASIAAPWGAAVALASSIGGAAAISSANIVRSRTLGASLAGSSQVGGSTVRRSRTLAALTGGVASVTSDATVVRTASQVFVSWAALQVPPRRSIGSISLAGAIAGVGGVSPPMLSRSRPLALSLGGATSLDLSTLRRLRTLSAALGGLSGVGGSRVNRQRPVDAAVSGQSSIVSALAKAKLLASATAWSSALGANLYRTRGLFGQADGQAVITANVLRRRGLATLLGGSSAVVSDLTTEVLRVLAQALWQWNWGMLEQVSNTVKFVAFFSYLRIGKTGLTVTVDVYNPAGTRIVTDGSAVELGGGLYYYSLSSGSTGTEGEYIAVFKTATTAVDMQHVPSLWTIGRAGIENLNSPIGSLPSAPFIADTVWDEILAGHLGAGSAGERLQAAGAAGDPLASQVPGTYAVNSAGWAIGRMITQAIINTYIGKAVIGSKVEIVRGDAYMNVDGRALDFIDYNNIWPDLTGASITFTAKYTNPRGGTAPFSRSGTVLTATGNSKRVMVELPSSVTSGLKPGTENYDYDVQAILASGNPATLARGKMTVLDDITT